MPNTWYIDYVNGNDGNLGTSWAQAFKTLQGATAAKGVAAGDTCCVAESPAATDTGITGAWTHDSKTVTLSSGLTKNIELCENNWTAGPAGITSANASTDTFKQGTKSLKIVTAATCTTGRLLAYQALGAVTDFSGYKQISFWIRVNTTAVNAGDLQIVLCSDAAGAVAINTVNVPAMPAITNWMAFTIDTGAALGNNIQSVAVYSTVSYASKTIYVDNILACKDSTAADSLSLTSLISKNSANQGGTELWYAIQSINDTTVLIDNGPNQTGGTGKGYSGTTETVELYKRETIKTTSVSASNTVVQSVAVAGTPTAMLEYSGGWNISTSLQTGETFFDGQNGMGLGVQFNQVCIKISHVHCIKYSVCFYLGSGTVGNFDITAWLGHASNSGLQAIAGWKSIVDIVCYNSTTTGLQIGGGNTSLADSVGSVVACNNVNYGIVTLAPLNDSKFTVTTINNGTGIYASGDLLMDDSSIDEAAPNDVNCYQAGIDNHVISINHNAGGLVYCWTRGGKIQQNTSVRYVAAGCSILVQPTSAERTSSWPIRVVVARRAVIANQPCVVTGYLRRSDTSLNLGLVVKGGQLSGVPSDVAAWTGGAADAWTLVTLASFTPTESGVIEVELQAYGGTTYSGYAQVIELAQAGAVAPNLPQLGYWDRKQPFDTWPKLADCCWAA